MDPSTTRGAKTHPYSPSFQRYLKLLGVTPYTAAIHTPMYLRFVYAHVRTEGQSVRTNHRPVYGPCTRCIAIGYRKSGLN